MCPPTSRQSIEGPCGHGSVGAWVRLSPPHPTLSHQRGPHGSCPVVALDQMYAEAHLFTHQVPASRAPNANRVPPPTAINDVRTRGESCGGEVTCVVRRCPRGLGSPVFDKLEAELAKAMLSLPATKVGLVGMCADRVLAGRGAQPVGWLGLRAGGGAGQSLAVGCPQQSWG